MRRSTSISQVAAEKQARTAAARKKAAKKRPVPAGDGNVCSCPCSAQLGAKSVFRICGDRHELDDLLRKRKFVLYLPLSHLRLLC